MRENGSAKVNQKKWIVECLLKWAMSITDWWSRKMCKNSVFEKMWRCEDTTTVHGHTWRQWCSYLIALSISREVPIKPNMRCHYHHTLTIVHSARILNTISWESVRRSTGHALSLSLIYIPSSLSSGYHGSKELDSNNASEGWSLWWEEETISVSRWFKVWTDT